MISSKPRQIISLALKSFNLSGLKSFSRIRLEVVEILFPTMKLRHTAQPELVALIPEMVASFFYFRTSTTKFSADLFNSILGFTS
jgi:hypothetical protein